MAGDAKRLGFLIAALAVCAVIGVLLYLLGAHAGTPARSQPASLHQAMLEASHGKPEDANLGLLFSELNAQHFDGRLPDARVLWEEDLQRLDEGDYRQNGMTDGKTILLNAALKTDDADVRRTLCHEMVHVQFIAAGHRSTAHDAPFQAELRRVFDDGCFEAIWATAEEKASLEQWIDAERARLDAARAHADAQGAAVRMEANRLDRLFAELNDRIRLANAAGSGWPSAEEIAAAERQRTALNDDIAAHTSALAENERAQARFNEAVQRYNLMMAYPDGLAEDRAKGPVR